MCQEQGYSKNDYHNILGEAKVVFSANTQETLGISWYEGAIVDTIPMVPDRLSYSEMGIEEFLYPSQWTRSMDSYQKHKNLIMEKIVDYMDNYEKHLLPLKHQTKNLSKEFFSADNLYATINKGLNGKD